MCSSTPSDFKRSCWHLVFWLGLIACCIFLYWPGLANSQIPAFRDGYHFYFPQAVWLDRCFQNGQYFPLWNRHEGLGSSVPGQVSTALYYPLRPLWILPGLSLPQRYSLFLFLHILIAAVGISYAAKRLELNRTASKFAAVSYALSCPVLFQQYNMIYLCSAAWVGFFIGSLSDLWRAQNRQQPIASRGSLVIFSLSISAMILGGDPHTAVNCGILAAAGTLFLMIRGRGSLQSRVRGLGFLMSAVTLIALVTAVQWIPAWRWSRFSNRTEATATQYLPTADSLSPEHRALVDEISRIEVDPMRRYDFSVSPWHLATNFWPTFGGHYQSENSRWFTAIGSEGRMWVPSIYVGLAPVLMALLSLFRPARHRWLVWVAVFSLAASFGNYSPMWLIREVCWSAGWSDLAARLPPDQYLSIYGALEWLVPGYDSLRFPGKWTVLLAAATSLLGASCLDSYCRRQVKSMPIIPMQAIVMLGIGSALLLLSGVWLLWNPADNLLADYLPNDRWLGVASAENIGRSWCFSAILTGTLVMLLRFATPSWIVLITMLEMTLVGGFWCHFVNAPQRNTPTISGVSEEQQFVWTDITEADIARFKQDETSLMAEQKAIQDEFLLGKISLVHGFRNLAATSSIEPLLLEKLRAWLSVSDDFTTQQPELDQMLASLGVTHRLAADSLWEAPALTWETIDNPQALCQYIEPNSHAFLKWQWHKESCLIINTSAESAPRRLLLRQFNDGGWAIRAVVAGRWQSVDYNQPPTPFLEFDLPAGASRVEIKRKWLW